jgi:radical SAM protein with 4Fe4S-binding SPASM domain
MRQNIAEVKAFARRWRARGVGVFIYSAHDRAGSVDRFDERLRMAEHEVPLGERLGRRAVRLAFHHCPIPFVSTNILHDGQMLMCVHDWGRKVVVGSVREASIAELWNGERMREVRREVFARRYERVAACRDCSLVRDGWF